MPVPMSITRGATATVVHRGDVPQGAVFAVKSANGRLGTHYASIGANGRCYSVNLNTKAVASSGNHRANVTLTGKWRLNVKRDNIGRTGMRMHRRDVRPGEVFMVHGGEKEYAHIGRIDKDRQGWLSLPLSNLNNHAVAENGDSTVQVVGTYTMEVTLTR